MRIIDSHDVITGEKKYYEFAGDSSEQMPTNTEYPDISTGSIAMIVNTKKVYMYNENTSSWVDWTGTGGT